MKQTFLTLFAAAIIMAGAYMFASVRYPAIQDTNSVTQTPAISDSTESSLSQKTSVPNTATGVSTVTPKATSVPSNVSTQKASGYTITQVALHNTAASCWSVVNGKVYDLTSWIGQHPGGSSAILSMCGVDGSAAFNGQHGGQARPTSELAAFLLGSLIGSNGQPVAVPPPATRSTYRGGDDD